MVDAVGVYVENVDDLVVVYFEKTVFLNLNILEKVFFKIDAGSRTFEVNIGEENVQNDYENVDGKSIEVNI